jgi:hypothetical protein
MLEGSLMATPFGYSSSLDTIVPFHPPQITLPRYGNSVSVTDFSTRRGANSFVRDQQGVDPEATVTQPPSRASLGVFVPGISAQNLSTVTLLDLSSVGSHGHTYNHHLSLRCRFGQVCQKDDTTCSWTERSQNQSNTLRYLLYRCSCKGKDLWTGPRRCWSGH